MMALYRLFSSAASMIVYPYGRMKAAWGRELWRGRLALIPHVGPRDVWLHAASVGEVKVIGILTDYLLRKNPGLSMHVTVTTSAGFKTALSIFGQQVSISFLPLDTAHFVRRTLSLVAPRMLVIAETEIWPNLITEASKRHIPVILINGRMSQSAFDKYKLFRSTFSHLLGRYDRFFFKTDEDRDRYRYFGIADNKIAVAGDIKFDAPLMQATELRKGEIRYEAGMSESDFMFVAGSTRPGEEDMLLSVYCALKLTHSRLRLVLAPRHLDRLNEVRTLVEQKGLTCSIYGEPSTEQIMSRESIVLVDRMGVLNDLYSSADLAFVGGTLVNLGGHNILEPVWAGTPVVFGPYLDNVKEAADYIVDNDLGGRVRDVEELKSSIEAVLNGQRRFRIKTESGHGDSPTTTVGRYILERLNHA